MAEQTPQNVNPEVDPQVEDAASTAVPVAEIDISPAPVAPATNPEVPQPAPEQAVTLAPPPDEAFLEQQTAQENRWIQAAATNPDGINRNGSVVIDRGGGVRETINRDGSYEISSGSGTVRYDAAGQQTSYTTPTINGLSQTYTTDGVVVETSQQGPLRTETISYNGELVSTNITLQTGDVTLQQIQVGEGPPVNAAITVIPNLTEGTAGIQITQAQVGDGEIVTSTLDLEQRRLDRLAADEARVEAADQLREDILASQAQVESGIPLSATQLAAIEEQARALEAAEAAVAQADEALAEADPTVVAADTDPQVVAPADQDPIPAFDTTEFAPAPVDPANDAGVAEMAAAQEQADFVPVADIDTGPADVDPEQDPEVAEFAAAQEEAEFVPVADVSQEPTTVIAADDPEVAEFQAQQEQAEFVPVSELEVDPTVVSDNDPQVPADTQELFVSDLVEPSADDPQLPVAGQDLPEAFVYQEAEVPETDPIVLAQADNIATDVALVDVTEDAVPVDADLDPTVPQPVEAISEGGFYGEPTPVGGDFTSVYNPETGTYDVVDLGTGEVVETGLSQQAATITAQDLSLGDPQFPNDTEDLAAVAESDLIREPTDVDVAEAAFTETDTGFFELQEEAAPQPDEFGFVETEGGLFVQQDEIEAQIDQEQFENELGAQEFPPASEINTEPETVDPNIDLDAPVPDAEGENELVEFTANGPVTRDAGEATAEAARIEAQRQNLRNQQAIREQRGNNVDSADWRVRLRLAPNARYLYLDDTYGPGILDPLAVSDGIIFPYTPTVQTVYKADYTPYNLTHSNYRGFFYQSSYVEDVQITGTFTAQDSVEAAYLLAVIHFFRSATKMFYGGDPQRGAPPPLVFLSAFGAYQYVDAPCVISQFNYNLPADVDYIRARSPNQDGTNLLKRRQRQSLPTNAFSSALQRLKNARPGGLPQGGEVKKPAPPTLGLQSPTYVPTKMDITIVLHPMQSRRQVSQQFSLREYAPGRLTPKGFW